MANRNRKQVNNLLVGLARLMSEVFPISTPLKDPGQAGTVTRMLRKKKS
jgi:hypothetical protein